MPARAAEPRLLLTAPHYTEGCVVDSDANLYFSQTAASTILVVPLAAFERGEPAAAEVRTWAHVAAANGHAIARDGTHFVAASVGAFLQLDAAGRTLRVLATHLAEQWLVYPNDVVIDPQRGGCWYTDSGYKATPASPQPDGKGRICRVDAAGNVSLAASGLQYANGIALTPDGRRLLVGESVTSRVWSYAIEDGARLGVRTLFAELPRAPGAVQVPDGITIDAHARVFIAHYGAGEVLVYGGNGGLVARLPAGNRAVSHVALAPDGQRAYASGGIESERGEGAIFELDLSALPPAV